MISVRNHGEFSIILVLDFTVNEDTKKFHYGLLSIDNIYISTHSERSGIGSSFEAQCTPDDDDLDIRDVHVFDIAYNPAISEFVFNDNQESFTDYNIVDLENRLQAYFDLQTSRFTDKYIYRTLLFKDMNKEDFKQEKTYYFAVIVKIDTLKLFDALKPRILKGNMATSFTLDKGSYEWRYINIQRSLDRTNYLESVYVNDLSKEYKEKYYEGFQADLPFEDFAKNIAPLIASADIPSEDLQHSLMKLCFKSRYRIKTYHWW
jgi:hypothetical protein